MLEGTVTRSHPSSGAERGTRGRDARVIAVVPVLDEEASVATVVAQLLGCGVERVIVVDNGSTDASAERARRAGARIVEEPRRGYGRACQAGVVAAAAERADIVLFADGDGSDVLEDVPMLLAPLRSGELDFVVGARAATPALPWHVRVGNRIATLLLRLLFRANYSDLGPLRAVRLPALVTMGMREPRCGWTVEMQARAAVLGVRSGEVLVRYRPRVTGSKISGTLRGSFTAGRDIFATLFRVAWDVRVSRCD